MASKLEKENLEAHVDLCAERYKMLEDRLDEMKNDFKEDRKIIHERIDKVKDSISDLRDYMIRNHNAQNKVIITSAVAIIIALIGGLFVLISMG